MKITIHAFIRSLAISAAAALMVILAPSLRADVNLVQNPGFETGDFTGWTLANTSNATFVDNGSYIPVLDGTYSAALGEAGTPGTLMQTLSTSPGSQYNLSFWLYNGDIGVSGTYGPSSFSVSWDGTALSGGVITGTSTPVTYGPGPLPLPLTNPPAFDYTQYTFNNLTASTGSTVLQFVAQNDPNYFGLDDVSVTAVPESATVALFGFGCCGFALMLRRRRK